MERKADVVLKITTGSRIQPKELGLNVVPLGITLFVPAQF